MKKVSYRGIPFYLPPPGEKHDSRSVGMSYWFEDNLKTALTCVDHLWFAHSQVELQEIYMLELFAGMGVSAAYLKGDRIKFQVGIDHNAENLEAYKLTHPSAKSICGDTYTTAQRCLSAASFNYILFEHNALTMYRAAREEKERALLDAVFQAGAEYILFVDSAKPKEHLHWKNYSAFYGFDMSSSKSYLEGVSQWVSKTYGYGMISPCAHDSVNYSMLFKKGAPVVDMELVDTRKVVDLGRYHATV
jgi:hypothetical protein